MPRYLNLWHQWNAQYIKASMHNSTKQPEMSYFDFSCIVIPWFVLRSPPRLTNQNVILQGTYCATGWDIEAMAMPWQHWIATVPQAVQKCSWMLSLWTWLGVEMCGKFPWSWLSSVYSVEHTALGPAGYFHRETPLWDARLLFWQAWDKRDEEASASRENDLRPHVCVSCWPEVSLKVSRHGLASTFLLENILVALVLHKYFEQAHYKSTNA